MTMWEQIRVNKRNSVLLLSAMALGLAALGALLGAAFGGPDGLWIGMIVATAVWFVMMLISFSSGDQILLASSRAKPVTPDVHPQLFNIVEEMTIAASLPKMPKIYIINDPAPNAFATGRKPETASIAVTAGLLSRLNRDELQGVVAHEMSHILHRDILYITLAGVMLGSIVLISQVFLRGMFYSSMGSRRRYSSSDRGGGGQIVFILIAIVAAILAPLFAQILYFTLSRRREYLADAGGVRLTRYPEGLAGALEKIAAHGKPMEAANKATAPMYISNPFSGKRVSNLFSTHPPIEERIRILRSMSQGASLRDYSEAYSRTVGKPSVLPPSAQADEESVPLRTASPVAAAAVATAAAEPQAATRQRHREMGDIMRKVNGFRFLECACGLKLKVPPSFRARHVPCPRCGRALNLD